MFCCLSYEHGPDYNSYIVDETKCQKNSSTGLTHNISSFLTHYVTVSQQGVEEEVSLSHHLQKNNEWYKLLIIFCYHAKMSSNQSSELFFKLKRFDMFIRIGW